MTIRIVTFNMVHSENGTDTGNGAQ